MKSQTSYAKEMRYPLRGGDRAFFSISQKRLKFLNCFFYVSVEDIPFVRVYSPSMKSKDSAPHVKNSL